MPVKKRRKSRIKPVVPIRTLEDSPNQLDRRLVAAYLSTNYRVPVLNLNLRINQPDPAAQAWLERQNMAAFAILTAWNPGSVLRPEPENQVQNTLMERQLRTVAKCVLPATSIGDLGDWPAEEGFFAAGIDPESAIQLAAEFGQNALVFCKTGETPELWWLEGTEE